MVTVCIEAAEQADMEAKEVVRLDVLADRLLEDWSLF